MIDKFSFSTLDHSICFSGQNSDQILEEFSVHLLFLSLKFNKKFKNTMQFFLHFIFFWQKKQMNNEFFKIVMRILDRKVADYSYCHDTSANWWKKSSALFSESVNATNLFGSSCWTTCIHSWWVRRRAACLVNNGAKYLIKSPLLSFYTGT